MGEQGGMLSYDPTDSRTRIMEAADIKDQEKAKAKRLLEITEKYGGSRTPAAQTSTALEMLPFVLGAFAIVLGVGFAGFYILLQFFGDA